MEERLPQALGAWQSCNCLVTNGLHTQIPRIEWPKVTGRQRNGDAKASGLRRRRSAGRGVAAKRTATRCEVETPRRHCGDVSFSLPAAQFCAALAPRNHAPRARLRSQTSRRCAYFLEDSAR